MLNRGLTDLVNSISVKLINDTINYKVSSYTLFVDDIMVFYKGDATSNMVVKSLLLDMPSVLAKHVILLNPSYMLSL